MTAQTVLNQLVSEFQNHPGHDAILSARQAALSKRRTFLQLYDPADIGACLRPRQQAENLLSWLENDLRALGGINLRSNKPHKSAADNRHELIWLFGRMFDPKLNPFERLDLPWDRIPYFGGDDRQIAKKIISIYYPDETMPIFNTTHHEYFIVYLGLDKDQAAQQLYGKNYRGLETIGHRWHVLSELLLREKRINGHLMQEDNVYFMYCLYSTSACPPETRPSGTLHRPPT